MGELGSSNYMPEGLDQPHWIQMLAANSQALASTPSSSGNSPSQSLEQKLIVEQLRMAALERSKQEAQKRKIAAAQNIQAFPTPLSEAVMRQHQRTRDWCHAMRKSQEDKAAAGLMAAQKIKEEKAAAERLAAQAELAELFAPQHSAPLQMPVTSPLHMTDSKPPRMQLVTKSAQKIQDANDEPAYRAQDWMTKAQFRAMRQRAGFPLNADQHVCHIIAESNGGANHIDNYYVAAGSLNQSLGNRNDSYLAEAAGLEQTKKAVAVSRIKGYTGPGAEDLIAMAKVARKGLPTIGGLW